LRSSLASAVPRCLLVLSLLAAACIPGWAAASPPDPLLPVTLRISQYFREHETDGVTRDSRYALNPPEVIRLSVVSQLLAYNDLCATLQRYAYYQEVVDRADFLVKHFGEITSGTGFDGMLGYALLGAYDLTGNTRYLSAALPIVDLCMRLSGAQNRLNWGLMSAMALAKYYRLTGDPAALEKTRKILDSVVADQFASGNFAHYCNLSTDLHYTAWMGMELLHVQRYVDYPPIEQVLQRIDGFLKQRVGDNGRTTYEAPCPGVPGCWIYYYSRRTGCPQDYDTRGWINELGYNAMVFDHFHETRYSDVMRFLDSLEVRGTVADKWDYRPPVSDPIYPWATADTSVIRASVVFWSLASICNSRYASWLARYLPPRGPLAGRTLPILMAELSQATAPGEVGVDDYAAMLAANAGTALRHQWSAVDSLVIAGAEEDPAGTDDLLPVRKWRTGLGIESADPVSIVSGDEVGGVTGAQPPRPAAARLGPLVPNPASRTQTLRFSLTHEADVSLAIYDTGGRRIRELVSGRLGPGEHAVVWDRVDGAGRLCPSGLYFVQLRAGDEMHSARILLTR
jgi:hypothetical protein